MRECLFVYTYIYECTLHVVHICTYVCIRGIRVCVCVCVCACVCVCIQHRV